jgi:Flp pilus assembly protein TadG
MTTPLTQPTDPTRDDRGSITIYAAIIVIALLAIIGLTLDGGGKLSADERADEIAQEAARAGSQGIDVGDAVLGTKFVVDESKARGLAMAYLASQGYPDAAVTFSKGDTQINVAITTTYDTRFLQIVDVTTLPVHGSASASLLYGLNTPEGS